jgi:hypothetical protein
MKQTLIFTLLLSGIFASNPITKIEKPVQQAPKNVGHFIFPIGFSGGVNQKSLFSGYGGIGYQTKIRDASYIQSISFEIASRYQIAFRPDYLDLEASIKSCTYLPKISFIRYLNSKAENRLFFSAGPYFSLSYNLDVYAYENTETAKDGKVKRTITVDDINGNIATTAGAVFGIGIEFGHSYGALNILKLEYNLPVKHNEHQMDYFPEFKDMKLEKVSLPNQTLNNATINITYAVGF